MLLNKNCNYKKIFDPRNTTNILILIFFIIYTINPIIFYFIGIGDWYLIEVSYMSFIAILSIKTGDIVFRKIKLNKIKSQDLEIYSFKDTFFSYINIILFLCILLLLIINGNSIPLISVMYGNDAESLSITRGAFMKPEDGFNYFLIYLFSIQISSIIPYCIVFLYESKNFFRHIIFFIGLFASISTLVKAMFFNILIPFFSLRIITVNFNKTSYLKFFGIISSILVLMTFFAGFNVANSDEPSDFNSYLSVSYQSKNSLDFILWRAAIIPVLGARDTLIVHDLNYFKANLLGVTSGIGAKVIGQEKINIEQEVFGYQYGGVNRIGNSNVTFFIDAYINFGYLGIIFYGILVGLLLRILINSDLKSATAIAPLFAIFLYSSSLVGILISNGFIFLYFWFLIRRIIN
jgi:hypothetical protein